MEWLRAFSMSKARAANARFERVRVALGIAARVTMTQGVTHWLAGVNAYISNRLFSRARLYHLAPLPSMCVLRCIIPPAAALAVGRDDAAPDCCAIQGAGLVR
jgi:hypothetical protein